MKPNTFPNACDHYAYAEPVYRRCKHPRGEGECVMCRCPAGHTAPNPKGLRGGNCNRTACQKPNAIYYNHSTRKYYCPACAMMLNEYSAKEAKEMFGHDLCTIDGMDAVARFGDALSEIDKDDRAAIMEGVDSSTLSTEHCNGGA